MNRMLSYIYYNYMCDCMCDCRDSALTISVFTSVNIAYIAFFHTIRVCTHSQSSMNLLSILSVMMILFN